MNIENIIHEDLTSHNLVDALIKLKAGLTSDILLEDKYDIPKLQLNVALDEFIDLVQFSNSLESKEYVVARLLRLKSSKKLLQEISSYLPIDFDFSIDPADGIPKTDYTPKLLKISMKSLTISNISVDFLEVIDNMFNSLLYFLEYRLSVQELIYKISVDLNKSIVGSETIPMRYIKLDTNYFI